VSRILGLRINKGGGGGGFGKLLPFFPPVKKSKSCLAVWYCLHLKHYLYFYKNYRLYAQSVGSLTDIWHIKLNLRF
jgi:hypothetical protein